MKSNLLYSAAAFVAGIFAGGLVLRSRVEEEARQEIEDAKEYYRERSEERYQAAVRSFVHKWEGEEAAEALEFKDGQPLLGKLLKAEKPEEVTVEGTSYEILEQINKDNGYTSYNTKPPVPVRPEGPTTSTEGVKGAYVISQEEFYDRGLEKQNQITYYAGNDVLVSAKGKIVKPEDRPMLIGLDTLSKFGEGSGEDTVVYVRNPSLGAGVDFEITLDEGVFHVVGGDD